MLDLSGHGLTVAVRASRESPNRSCCLYINPKQLNKVSTMLEECENPSEAITLCLVTVF